MVLSWTNWSNLLWFYLGPIGPNNMDQLVQMKPSFSVIFLPMTSYKVRASLPGSKGKIRCEVGKVATREEQFAIHSQNKLKLYIKSNQDSMNAENFKESCKSYVEETL